MQELDPQLVQSSLRDTSVREVGLGHEVSQRALHEGRIPNASEMKSVASEDIDRIAESLDQTDRKTVTDVAGSPKDLPRDIPLSDADGKVLTHINKVEASLYSSLRPEKINDADVFVRAHIDLDPVDALGQTNRERMARGLSTIGEDGRPMHLHHIGQNPNGPYAELTTTEHTRNYRALHPITHDSNVSHGPEWNAFRENHWKERLAMLDAA